MTNQIILSCHIYEFAIYTLTTNDFIWNILVEKNEIEQKNETK
jgi:hypothetical protein